MKFILFSVNLCILLIFAPSIFAQLSGNSQGANLSEIDKKNKRQTEVAEQILVEAKQLKFPQDRAYVLGVVSEFVCRTGSKERAEKIFEESIKELNTAQKTEKNTDDKLYENLIYGNFPRTVIIQSIKKCDAEMAYKFLLQSRPPKLSQILDDLYKKLISPEPKSVADDALINELLNESSIKTQIIRSKPERLVEFINQDIEKVISYNTIDLIKSLNRKDSELANELMEKAVNKILRLKFYDYENKTPIKAGFYYNLLIAISFLRELEVEPSRNPLRLTISEETLKKLADVVSKEIIDSGLSWLSSDSLKTIKLYFPERITQLEKIKTDRENSPENLEKRKYRQMFKENLPDENILAAADTFSEKNKKNVLKFVACRQVGQGNFEKAKNLLDQNFTENRNSDILLSYVIYSNSLQFVGEKDYITALKFAEKIPVTSLSIEAQVFILKRFYSENPEQNKAQSLIMLSELTKQIDSIAKTENKIPGLGKILEAYALIDANQAFPLFDFLIFQTNKTDFVDPTNSLIKDIAPPGMRTKTRINFDFLETLKYLSKSDFDKTMLTINKFKNPISRIRVKLGIISNERVFSDFMENLQFCHKENSMIRFYIN